MFRQDIHFTLLRSCMVDMNMHERQSNPSTGRLSSAQILQGLQ